MTEIRIGTSGYSFQDWRGVFYPHNISNGEMLTFYAQRFTCAEINSTYYRIPHARVFQHMVNKTPGEFEFIVKVHAEVTHARKNPDRSVADLTTAIRPLMEQDKFRGFLAQFPYSFKNRFESRKYLIHLSQLTGDLPLFAEFRHSSWTTPPLYDFLKQHEIGYVDVDEPELPNLVRPQQVTTTDTAYVRFHGRNELAWWDGDKGDRYDYLYTASELEQWKDDITGILDRVKKIYLFFNNCYHGQAALNALDMKALLPGE
ncbi:MAG: DUF72 domain-containing protein [Candidatus Neomarinimicrobiota bacterium]